MSRSDENILSHTLFIYTVNCSNKILNGIIINSSNVFIKYIIEIIKLLKL